MPKKPTKEVLFGIQKQQLNKLSANEYKALKELCFLSKNMYNVALYNIRQYYFEEKKRLTYNSNYHLCKDNENYGLMNSNSAQQIMKVADRDFESFFALIKKAKKGEYQYKQINMPRYKKKDGYFNLIFSEFNAKGEVFTVPMSTSFRRLNGKVKIRIPSNLQSKKIKEVRILPINNARFFEIQWIYEIQESQEKYDKNNVLAIDLGVDNLCTCVSNGGKAFIVDGKRLKSINHFANKKNARLQSIKDKQLIKKNTKSQNKLWEDRNNKVNDYLNKSAKTIIDFCIENNIGKIVIGYNPTIQKNINLGKSNNQNFVNIPVGNLKDKLGYLTKRNNIELLEQEESYTSKADFLANDEVPKYKAGDNSKYKFSGERITRGQYKSVMNVILNADINGALNIMKKANINNINLINNEYLNPTRIKIK